MGVVGLGKSDNNDDDDDDDDYEEPQGESMLREGV